MNDKLDYFMHLDLPNYGKVGIIEGKGIHWFNAIFKANKRNGDVLKYLVLELLVIDGKSVDEDFLNNMSLKDVSYLTTVIGTMIEDKFKI